jgi:hypothetical protein
LKKVLNKSKNILGKKWPKRLSRFMEDKKKKTRKKPASKTAPDYDQAVPAELLFLTNAKIKKPAVKLNHAVELSPFVVSFAQPKPIAAEETVMAKLNFAVNEEELKIAAENFVAEELSREEILPQLKENEQTPRRLPHPFVVEPLLPSWGSVHGALRDFQNKKTVAEPKPMEFVFEDLLELKNQPTSPTYFDLPEVEENETENSEIITWDEVVRSAVSESTPADQSVAFEELKKNFSFSFLWPKISVPEKIGRWQMSAGWHRALAAFVLISFAFVLPLHAMETLNDLRGAKNSLPGLGNQAVTKLTKAASLLTSDAVAATASFEAAKKDFTAARTAIGDLNATASIILSLLPATRSTYLSGNSLITAGETLAAAGGTVSQGLSAMSAGGLDTTGRLAILTDTFETVLPELEKAANDLDKVDPAVLPTEYQTTFSELKNLLPNFIASAKDIVNFSDTLFTLLGAEGKKRYLLLFQNNTEIRPTGGFIGSFAVLDVVRGQITNLEVPPGGSYDLQGSLKKNLVAPLPLQLLSARWEFQDSNWFPDFPTSARQAMEFYKTSGWPTVDGVVAINASFIVELLDLLGPVEMNDYDRTIDSENFMFETQKIVEYDYAAFVNPDSERSEAAPKAFIGDLAKTLLAKTDQLDPNLWLRVLDSAKTALNQKNLQLYFPDESLEKVVRELGWAGEVKASENDYLMVVNANLGGGKTDQVIEEKIDLVTDIQKDGTIINTLTIKRKHHGLNGAIFTGVNNVNFLRIFVPKGSRLISADGFSIPDASLFEKPEADWEHDLDLLFNEETTEIDPNSGTMISEESGKTVFGNWTQTRPGETSTITFIYELPFKLMMPGGLLQTAKDKIGLDSVLKHSLLIQKQSGLENRATSIKINASYLQTIWASETNTSFDNVSDHLINFVFE